MLSAAAVLLSVAALAAATPTPSVAERATSCTVTAYSQVASAVASCTAITISSVAVPAGDTLDLSKLKSGTTVTFTGTTTFGYKEWAGPLVKFGGTNVHAQGTGVLDGNGAQYWDGQGSNGGKTKPKFFAAHSLTSSTISGITLRNMPVQGYSIDSASYLTLSNVIIDNSAGTAEGHNTDAFDIGSSDHVEIHGATVSNQDDCVAVNSGTNYYFTGLSCTGGHGLSIGSVGGRSDNTVSNVTFASSSVSNSQNGVRIKTVYGATGTVSGVTYSGITLSGITNYGVVIEQDYENGSPTGTPTTGVPITGLTLKSVTGSVSSSAKDYYILCGSGACSGWTFSGVSVTGGKSNSCNYKPSGFGC